MKYITLVALILIACGNSPTDVATTEHTIYYRYETVGTPQTYTGAYLIPATEEWVDYFIGASTHSFPEYVGETGDHCAFYCTGPSFTEITVLIYVDGEPRWEATGSDSVYVEGWL